MTKSAEFGVPTPRVPTPGWCRICGEGRASREGWADGPENKTLCMKPECIAAARAEIVAKPEQTADITRPYTGKRYGFAPR